jgi:hypothetical protein
MASTRLHNLDELALSVRDHQSRAYVEEAVSAHRAGANRAAIVTLWTTIVYDVIQKIRELSNSGDPNATTFVQRYEDAVRRSDLRVLQSIEENIVETARTDFEMVQAHEATALLRVREDRHLCAHPAMTLNDTLFQPTPDIVQAHVVHAVTFLLAHAPMQGKSALDRIYADIMAPSFPLDAHQAAIFLDERYLKRAKPSLLRNLLVVLLKKHVGKSAEVRPEVFSISLDACLRSRRADCEAIIEHELPKLAPTTPHDRLLNVLMLADVDPRCWDWCGEATRLQIRETLKSGRQHERYTPRMLRGASRLPDIAPLLTDGFEKLDDAQKLRLAELSPRVEYVKPMISRYAAAWGFRDAGAVGQRAIVHLAPHMSAEDVVEVIRAAQGNGQIHQAAETPDVLNAVFDATIKLLPKTRDAWNAFVDERRAKEETPAATYAYPELAKRLAQHAGPTTSTIIEKLLALSTNSGTS